MTSTGNWNVAQVNRWRDFSDYLLAALKTKAYSAFQIARSATQIAHPVQTPWLDDNGNGVPMKQPMGKKHNYAVCAVDLSREQWPPYIVQAVGPTRLLREMVCCVLQYDDEQVRRVWAVIYAPAYRPPRARDGAGALPTLVLLNQGGSEFAATYGF